MSVELQLRDAETLNLTLYSSSNHSSLHLHPPEEGEEEEEKERDDEGQRKAFYCCLPVPPTSESANQSRCLLWLANQTVLTATAKERLLWKRKGRCQDERALCSPCGHCGFTLRLERGEERNGPISFHFRLNWFNLIQTRLLSQSTVESFFSIEQISLNSSSLKSNLSSVTLFPFLSLYCMIRELQYILICCISKAVLILACSLSIRHSNTPRSLKPVIFSSVCAESWISISLPFFHQTFPYSPFLFFSAPICRCVLFLQFCLISVSVCFLLSCAHQEYMSGGSVQSTKGKQTGTVQGLLIKWRCKNLQADKVNCSGCTFRVQMAGKQGTKQHWQSGNWKRGWYIYWQCYGRGF